MKYTYVKNLNINFFFWKKNANNYQRYIIEQTPKI